MKRRDYQRAKKRVSNKRLVIKVSIFAVLSAILLLTFYVVDLQRKASTAVQNAYEAIDDREKSDLREEAVEPLTDNVSVLFIGVDESDKRMAENSSSLSDALLVATLNNKNKTVKLLSIPRDSYVYIPEVGYKDKITHAHAFGGTRATVDTVERVLDIPIDYYVKMNFNAFIEVVDALGGVEVEVPYEHIELDENDVRSIHLKPGLQELDGRHALALARTRKLDSDVERGKRQQMIFQALLDRATSLSSVTKYGDLIEAVGDNMKTDMTFDEMKSFFAYVKNGLPDIETLTLAGTDDWSTGIYYWLLDEDELDVVRNQIQGHLNLFSSPSTLTEGSSGHVNSNEIADENSYQY